MKKRRPRDESTAWTWNLQVVAPDSKNPHDPRRATARELDETVGDALEQCLPKAILHRRVPAAEASRLAQLWVVEPDRVVVGSRPWMPP